MHPLSTTWNSVCHTSFVLRVILFGDNFESESKNFKMISITLNVWGWEKKLNWLPISSSACFYKTARSICGSGEPVDRCYLLFKSGRSIKEAQENDRKLPATLQPAIIFNFYSLLWCRWHHMTQNIRTWMAVRNECSLLLLQEVAN